MLLEFVEVDTLVTGIDGFENLAHGLLWRRRRLVFRLRPSIEASRCGHLRHVFGFVQGLQLDLGQLLVACAQ